MEQNPMLSTEYASTPQLSNSFIQRRTNRFDSPQIYRFNKKALSQINPAHLEIDYEMY
jgi:hypothetical protein